MDQLKIMQYIKEKPFNCRDITSCHFCKQQTKCYISNHYYSSAFVPLSICKNSYKEMEEFPNQMILIDTLLSLNVVDDIKKIIQLLIAETKTYSKCNT